MREMAVRSFSSLVSACSSLSDVWGDRSLNATPVLCTQHKHQSRAFQLLLGDARAKADLHEAEELQLSDG